MLRASYSVIVSARLYGTRNAAIVVLERVLLMVVTRCCKESRDEVFVMCGVYIIAKWGVY